MYKLLMVLCISLSPVLQAYAQAPESVEPALEIYGNACEKVIAGESKSSTRVRAADKAIFLGVKRLDELSRAKQILNEHDQNVMVYRLVDEKVEDLTVSTVEENDTKVCVEVKGWLSSEAISEVEKEFIADNTSLNEVSPEVVAEVAKDVSDNIAITPQNPESLALLHIKTLEYYNGSKSNKYTQKLEDIFADNPYFYLTDDEEIADYVVAPKVLKAKVDKLDAGHKRLQMVVVLEIKGLKEETVNEYQNRFVLFGAEEDDQDTASRLLEKLLSKAGDGALRKIEHQEQVRQETAELGRPLSK